jgi:hypothetical protein
MRAQQLGQPGEGASGFSRPQFITSTEAPRAGHHAVIGGLGVF